MNETHGPAGTIDAGLLRWLTDTIHGWIPHTSAFIDWISTLLVLVIVAAVSIHGALTQAEKPLERAVRVGFAAAPIPVFGILPLLPYDPDLAAMMSEERLLLALAAFTGLLWTIREIRNAFRD